MKKETHPKYQKVLFVDTANNKKFVCGSTLQPKQKEKFEGVEYPVYHLSISSSSHPFFTGSSQLVDAEGRVEKFKNRYLAAQQKKPAVKDEEKGSKEEPAKKRAKAAKKS